MTVNSIRSTCALSMLALSLACGDDGATSTGTKGRVDREALEAGATVTINGQTGEIAVPMAVAIPEDSVGESGGGDDDLQNELEGAVTLTVRNNTTGTTVNLASGTIVDTPTAPGQWSWALNGARDNATMTFFNETTVGQVLYSANQYTAELTISGNGYIEAEDAFTIPVTVVGN